MSDAMPMRFGRAVWLSLIGAVATYVCWFALAVFFWGPFWSQLQRHGMYVHDIDNVFLITFGPFVVAVLFLLTAYVAAVFERKRFENGRPQARALWRIPFFGIFPAAMIFALINGPPHDGWYFPLSEIAVCLVGLALGYVWVRMRRADEPIDRPTTVAMKAL